jgi:hypothetical protein
MLPRKEATIQEGGARLLFCLLCRVGALPGRRFDLHCHLDFKAYDSRKMDAAASTHPLRLKRRRQPLAAMSRSTSISSHRSA